MDNHTYADLRWQDAEPNLAATSNHTDWLSCFDAEGSRRRYAHEIYGSAAAEMLLDWRQLDVVYPQHLIGLNRTCWFNSKFVYRRGILGATFIDYPQRRLIPNGEMINRGGQRMSELHPPHISRWPWVEVMHSPSYGVGSMSTGNLWMYVARGSGLWFRPGRVLALSDVFDLAVYLNATSYYNARNPSSKAQLLLEATQRLNATFDSIAFSYHVDGGCCHRMVMHELVSLRAFSLDCPVSADMRRGWPPEDLRACNCSSGVRIC